MNKIFQKNPKTAKRKLLIQTYNVIPMTNRVGIIEWVENTTPLKKIIEDELKKEGNQVYYLLVHNFITIIYRNLIFSNIQLQKFMKLI